MFTKQALGAFLAGGVLVGGITFAGVAHGAGTAATTSGGTSDAQYTAKHAWVATAPNGVTTTLPIPAGERLTITSLFTVNGQLSACALTNASLNGTPFTLTNLQEDIEGGTPSAGPGGMFQPVSLDSGTMTCPYAATVVGYLTPIPAG
jgi:hypothetical protein